MRIGIDASSLIQKKSGIGSFAEAIIPALKKEGAEHQFFIYQPTGSADLSTPRRILWEAFELPRRAIQDRIDVFYSPGFAPPFWGPFKKVVTVHDLIGLVYRENVRGAARFYWSFWLPRAIARANTWVASSECTRRDVERYLKIPEKKVRVVPLASNSLFRKILDPNEIEVVLKSYQLKKPYLISVSTLEPRKNLLNLLEAYSQIVKSHPDLHLLLVGKDGGAEASLRQKTQELGLGQQVHFLGYVPEDDLTALYNAALGYVMISLYEGFGLPVLEAMKCGLTGVVSNNSSLPEITRGTAIEVDPKNLEDIQRGILELVTQSPTDRESLALKAFERSKQFTYTQVAKSMMQVFGEVYP